MRSAKRFASVAVSANCQNGSPKRRASSSPTQAASSVGSIAVEPRAACAAIAWTTGSGACPAIAPVSPRQKSMYSRPSTSTTRAPFASCTKTGKSPAQRAIQLIGTPNRSEERERSLSSSERGWLLRNASPSSSSRAASRSRSIATSGRPAASTVISVDLRHHVLDLRVVLEGVHRQILAVARLLVAAVRHLGDERDVVVDPDRPELEPARRVQRAADVPRPHGRRQAVRNVVRPRERLVVVGESLHGDDRAEDLLLDDLVLLADLADHRRLDEEAAVAVRAAARQHLRAGRPLEEPEDAVLLRLRDHRAHLDVVARRGVADLQ